jgi:tetratricopeptide (TPR) repeat protein
MFYKMKKLVVSSLLIVLAFAGHLSAQTLADGIKMLNNENFTDAQNIFESLVKKEPTNALPHYYIGQVKYALEDYKGAKEAYAAGVKVSPKCNECNIGLAKLSLDNGGSVETTKMLDGLEKSNKKNASVLALIGDAYLFSKKPNAAKAIDLLTKSRDIDPKVASTWSHMGDAFKLNGDLGNAMSNYETAVTKDPSNLEAYMSMAQIWAGSRQIDLAIQKLEAALKLSPDYAPAYKLLYELLYKANQFKKMLPVLEKYVSLSGTDVKAKIRLVKFLCYQAKDYERAISEGQKLLNDKTLALKPYDIATLNRFLAWSYSESGKPKEAYDSSQELFKIAKQDTSVKLFEVDYGYLAGAALKMGKVKEAQSAYEELFKTDTSKKEEVYGNFAKMYYDSSDFSNAIIYYGKKNALKPLVGNDLYYLALAYSKSNKLMEADATFSKYLEGNPTAVVVHNQRGRIAQKLDDLDPAKATAYSAKPHYMKVVEYGMADKVKNKNSLVTALSFLAPVMVQQNDIAAAKAYYAQLLEVDPTNAVAADALKTLGN